MKEHPYLNPDYMTCYGVRWRLTEKQEEALRRKENDDALREEAYFGC